jgi:1,4-alpha-glucan branching enzyme
VSNFTPVVRHDYTLGVPEDGKYRELLNTDELRYGGSGVTNPDIHCTTDGAHGRPCSIRLSVPPLATIIIGGVR